MGLGFLFRLEKSAIERHKDERRVRTLEEDGISEEMPVESDNEIELEGDSEEETEDAQAKDKLNSIEEENSEKQRGDDSSDSEDNENSLFLDTQIKLDLSGPRYFPFYLLKHSENINRSRFDGSHNTTHFLSSKTE